MTEKTTTTTEQNGDTNMTDPKPAQRRRTEDKPKARPARSRTKMRAPDGRPYTASSPVEVTNLRARGYVVDKGAQEKGPGAAK